MMAKIAHDVPALLEARNLVDRFHEIMRQQKATDLDPWIAAAIASPLSSFAKGIIADRDAVQAAIIQPWSNGQFEGQITKAQAGEASDVWACKNRSARGTRHRRRVNNCTKSESEPSLGAYSHSWACSASEWQMFAGYNALQSSIGKMASRVAAVDVK